MTEEQFIKMIEMLVEATRKDKLKWDENGGRFITSVGSCKIILSSNYEVSIDSFYFKLALYNEEGKEFASYIYSDSTDKTKYAELAKLYNVINDRYYKISESEKIILEGLEELTKD